MSLLPQLAVLAARQILPGVCSALGIGLGDEAVEAVGQFLVQRFADHSRRLPAALQAATQRAWKALEIALAGESFWSWLDRAEDRALRQQIRAFLDAVPTEHLPAEQDDFRRHCLSDLRAARKQGRLDGPPPDLRELARHTADLARFADPQRLLQAEERIVEHMAQALGRLGHVHLARLLALRPCQGQSLLAVAARYFFHRAVEEDRPLFQGLLWASWEDLAAAQQRGFAGLDDALARHAQELDARLGELHAFLGQVHAVVVDIRAEQRRQGERFDDLYEVVLDVQRRLDGRAPAPPPGQQRQLPALLLTQQTLLTDPALLAEAHYHAFQAALRRRDWTKARDSYAEAVRLDPHQST